MALTNSEMEAKLAALEDRISLLFQSTDTLEWAFEHGIDLWEGWAVELQVATAALEKELIRLRNEIPRPRQEY